MASGDITRVQLKLSRKQYTQTTSHLEVIWVYT